MENSIQDAVIDKWVDDLKPQLKEALGYVIRGASFVTFQCGEATAADTKVTTPFFLFVAPELTAFVLQATAEGLKKAGERQQEIIAEMRKRVITQ